MIKFKRLVYMIKPLWFLLFVSLAVLTLTGCSKTTLVSMSITPNQTNNQETAQSRNPQYQNQ